MKPRKWHRPIDGLCEHYFLLYSCPFTDKHRLAYDICDTKLCGVEHQWTTKHCASTLKTLVYHFMRKLQSVAEAKISCDETPRTTINELNYHVFLNIFDWYRQHS